jgi:pheromone shutdown protein TraB
MNDINEKGEKALNNSSSFDSSEHTKTDKSISHSHSDKGSLQSIETKQSIQNQNETQTIRVHTHTTPIESNSDIDRKLSHQTKQNIHSSSSIEFFNRNNLPMWEKRIIIVGTSHVSHKSMDIIEKAISDYNPDLVCLELDAARFDALLHNRETKFSWKLVKQIGLFGTLFLLVGGSFQKYIAKKIGSKPGLDMMHGYYKGKESGARVALIDQPADVTLRRFSRYFKRREIFVMFWDTLKGLFGRTPFPMFDVREVPNEEVISQIVGVVSKRYPSVYRVLLEERNIYMTKRLMKLQEQFHTIVVVVGAAHKKEMEQLLHAQHYSTC